MTFDETLDQLDRALATTGRIVAGVAGDQWGDPTPCLVDYYCWVIFFN